MIKQRENMNNLFENKNMVTDTFLPECFSGLCNYELAVRLIKESFGNRPLAEAGGCAPELTKLRNLADILVTL